MKKLNIKSLLFFAFLTTIGYQANAQTTSLKLGTNPTIKHPSALLELEATNKGILMPRVALTSTTDVTTIASPANALTVFNTATVGDVTPGYYYYNTATSKWVRVSTEAWGLTGNAGTTPATNFLGTTDNQNLVLKAANNSLLTLGSNGKIGFGLSPDAYSPHRLQSNYSVRFGTPLDGSNQHFSLAQAPSASSGSSLQKPFSLIVGNSFLDRSDIFIGGGLWDGTEAAVQNIRFYTASTKDTPIGTERMVLDPNGNLGIGLSAPTNTLHVKATADPVRFEGLNAAALSDNVLTTDANGVMKKTSTTLADLAIEPWNVQNTSTKSTLNTDNIYQQGKVGVGFVAGDAVSPKQFAVKGDMNVTYATPDGFSIMDNNFVGFAPISSDPSILTKAGTNVMLSSNTSDPNLATKLGYVYTTNDILGGTGLSALGNKNGSYAADIQAFSGPTTSGARITSSDAVNKRTTEVSANSFNGLQMHDVISGARGTTVDVEHTKGVEFVFTNASGAIEGQYIFPRNNGTAKQVLTTNGLGISQLAWQDASSLVEINEPWKIQNTTNEATANSQNIYQQGKVAIGFLPTDAVSNKQFEVKGDLKAKYLSGGYYYGIETGDVGIGVPTTLSYVSNNIDISAATESTLSVLSPGTVNIRTINGLGGGSIGAYSDPDGGAVSMAASSNDGQGTSSIGVFNTNVQNYILLSNSQNLSLASNLFVEKSKGVSLSFANASGTTMGNYTFPRINGTANQVLVTDGGAASTGAQLAWKDLSTLIVNAIRTETGNYTAVTADETILVNAAGGNVVITLPNATTVKGKKYNVKKIDATGNTVQVVSAGGTVDGNAAATGVSGSLPWQGWVFQSDGTNWYIISRI